MAKKLKELDKKTRFARKRLDARLDRQRGYILTVFRSKRRVGVETEAKRKSEGQKTSGGAPSKVGRATWALLPLVTPFRPNLSRNLLILQKSNYPKI